MTEDEVRVIADQVLKPILGPFGFVSSEVESRPDHDGDDALYVTTHFSPAAIAAEARIHVDARVALIDALAERGERRYPYFRYDFPDDAAPFDEDEVYGAA